MRGTPMTFRSGVRTANPWLRLAARALLCGAGWAAAGAALAPAQGPGAGTGGIVMFKGGQRLRQAVPSEDDFNPVPAIVTLRGADRGDLRLQQPASGPRLSLDAGPWSVPSPRGEPCPPPAPPAGDRTRHGRSEAPAGPPPPPPVLVMSPPPLAPPVLVMSPPPPAPPAPAPASRGNDGPQRKGVVPCAHVGEPEPLPAAILSAADVKKPTDLHAPRKKTVREAPPAPPAVAATASPAVDAGHEPAPRRDSTWYETALVHFVSNLATLVFGLPLFTGVLILLLRRYGVAVRAGSPPEPAPGGAVSDAVPPAVAAPDPLPLPALDPSALADLGPTYEEEMRLREEAARQQEEA